MKTPERLTVPEFQEALLKFADQVLIADDIMICRQCLDEIQMHPAYISIHTTAFDNCAGAGQCEVLRIPYCPTCEPIPLDSGCIHVDYAIMRRADDFVAVWWSQLLGV